MVLTNPALHPPRPRHAGPAARATALLALTLGVGCSSDPAPFTSSRQGTAQPEPSEAVGAGPSALRKLTVSQYHNTVEDTFGLKLALDAPLEEDTAINGFYATASSSVTISPLGVERFESAAYQIAEAALSGRRDSPWLVCSPGGSRDDDCAGRILMPLGARLYRRPLTDGELSRAVELAGQAGTLWNDFHRGLTYAVSSFLQSPKFLFRAELGVFEPKLGPERLLSSFDVASRLSFLLWDSGPDAELLQAAAENSSFSGAALLDQAARLLRDPRSERGVQRFHFERWGLWSLSTLEKSPEAFPLFSDTLGESLLKEVELNVRDVVFNLSDYRTLFGRNTTFVNAELAGLYGVTAPSSGFEKVTLPRESERLGFLGSGAFLAANAHPSRTSPTLRGKFIRERVLCGSVPSPPADVDTEFPEIDDAGLTTRERTLLHSTEAACAGCHAFMDPLGLPFERFDGLGSFRDAENGVPIDTSGDLDSVPVEGPRELADLLAESPDVADCTVRHLFRFALGRGETAEEAEQLAAMGAEFSDSEYRFDELLLALVQTPSFHRAAAELP